MVLIRATKEWHAFDTEGRKMWQLPENQFTAPRGYIDGYFCGFKINNQAQTHQGILIDQSGSPIFDPQFGFRVNIRTPPDEFGLMLLENMETGEQFVGDRQSNIRSKLSDNHLNYLGNHWVAYSELVSNTDKVHTVVVDLFNNQIICVIENAIAADQYADGLLRVLDENGKIGFANLDGQFIIPPQYEPEFLTDARDTDPNFNQFVNGIAFLLQPDTVHCVDRWGNLIWKNSRSNVVFMGKHNVKIFDPESQKYWVTNQNGQIMNPQNPFDEVSMVNEKGFFLYEISEEQGAFHVSGRQVFKTSGYELGRISQTHFLLKRMGGGFEVFDEYGNLVNVMEVSEIIESKFGKITAETHDGKYAVYASDGKPIVPLLNGTITLQNGYFIEKLGESQIFFNDFGKKVLENPLKTLNGDFEIQIEKLTAFFPY
jgi:hypothetical protein